MIRIKNISPQVTLIVSIFFSNFLNFVFNAYLGRALSFEEFGLVTLLTTLGYLLNIFINALTATVNQKVSFLIGKHTYSEGTTFYIKVNQQIVKAGIIITIGFILLIPLLPRFFHISSYLPFILFIPSILCGLLLSSTRGYLSGKFLFQAVGILLLAESVSRLLIAFVFVNIGLAALVYISIPLSVSFAFICSYIFLKNQKETDKSKIAYNFPKQFFLSALIAGFASNAFLTFDLILVKHFLAPDIAGEYALLSLVGKMVYFLGSLPSAFIITFVSNHIGKGLNPSRIFYRLFSFTFVLAFGAFIIVGPLGNLSIPLLFGSKSNVILPYVTIYSAAITLFTLSTSIVSFHLARQNYLFPSVAIAMAVLMSLGMFIFHGSIDQIVQVMFSVGVFNFVLIGLLHFLEPKKLFLIKEKWIESYE